MSSSRSGNSEQPAAATATSGRTSPFLQSSSESAERHWGGFPLPPLPQQPAALLPYVTLRNTETTQPQVLVCVCVGGSWGGGASTVVGWLESFLYSWTGCIFTFMNEAGGGGCGGS